MGFVSDTVDTRRIEGKSATYAYRDFGVASSSPPLVLLTRFRATMDHWDPAFLDVLASERRVILFDNAGVSESSGEVASTFAGMAETAVDFIAALGLKKIDLLGWSIGGFVGQMLALNHPGLIRRLLVVGSGPGGVPGSPVQDPRVPQMMTAPVSTEEHFLYLFFGLDEESQRVGKESLKRLEPRLSKSHADVSAEAWGRQLQAIMKWAGGDGSAWSRLEEITIPVLVANGAHDVMVDAGDSFAMVRRLKNAKALFYGDAGHAFLFQHPDEFGKATLDFVR
ncbi:alpha/beta hydrolase [Bradyrhizobium sp. dw_411]|uniref:alpha/beta fold hydrolase n=1 Tax=Bradyrhizobium sp. dw_411 TaxID=2720082 RepID=UPI001BCF20D8|nr:alpha/beta hydrolase [Bradyrhizobium sp. dw_411]